MTTTADRHEVSAGTTDGRVRVLPTTPLGERSLGELFATLSRDMALLVHQEIELVKADAKLGMLKAAAGASGFAVAAVMLLLAAPIISIAIALGIHALGLTLGWSFLIVGGVYVLGAMMAAVIGIAAIRKVKPHTRAVDSMKADLHAIARKPKPTTPLT